MSLLTISYILLFSTFILLATLSKCTSRPCAASKDTRSRNGAHNFPKDFSFLEGPLRTWEDDAVSEIV
uniref:Candidate secreted effector n=1 Tax=Meloidogyne incognita TaxID=6306 RepID=A0A914KNF9_MELIC